MATSAQVQQLYLTYFGRPADPEGLRFWTSDTTTPLTTIANGFAGTPEFTASIAGKTFAQVVNQFYVSLFNRNAETAGLNYWVGLLQQGLITLQQVGLNISNAALAQPSTSIDFIAVTSKITAAGNFTTQVGSTTPGILAYTGPAGVTAGVQFLAPVFTTATIPNAAATTAAVNNLITSNSGVGTTVELSTFQDIFTPTSAVRLTTFGQLVETLPFRFTADSQSVGAPAGSLQSFDQLIDPSVSDSDNLNITVAPGLWPGPDGVDIATINIENFKFFLNGADGGGFFDFNNFGNQQTNVKSVTLSGTINPGGGWSVVDFGDAGATVLDASGVTTSGIDGQIAAIAFAAPAIGNANVTMIGGAGNDFFVAGFGADSLVGGAGIDTLNGLNGADTILGGSGSDVLFGGSEADTISGELDADTIFGDDGSDILSGNEANDTISGGLGNDSITGGTGVDSMTGDGGSDRFIYGSFATLVADTGNTQAGSDIITDFVSGADSLKTGVAGTATNFKILGASANYDAAKSAAQGPGGFDGAVSYIYTSFGTTGVLFVDTDNNNTADASILFTGAAVPVLVAADIIA
jgi:Ca2+-binding RTX toxin-like protein